MKINRQSSSSVKRTGTRPRLGSRRFRELNNRLSQSPILASHESIEESPKGVKFELKPELQDLIKEENSEHERPLGPQYNSTLERSPKNDIIIKTDSSIERKSDNPRVYNPFQSNRILMGNLSRSDLATRRQGSKASILRIDTMDMMNLDEKALLQNANFELGSSQFDIPTMKYTPRKITSTKPQKRMPAGTKVNIKKMEAEEVRDDFFDIACPKKPEVWQKMSKYITAKFTDDQSVRDLFFSKLMKDKIFDDIQVRFTKGEKLQRYDHYTREETYKAYLQNLALASKKDEKIPDLLKAEREKLLKQQREMEEATKNKERIASQQASYLKPKESDIEKQQKRFQLESVKEAIVKQTMSIDRANEILLNSVKNDNRKIIQDIQGKQSIKEFINKIQLQSLELDYEMKDVQKRSNSRSRSPQIQKQITLFDQIKVKKVQNQKQIKIRKIVKSAKKIPQIERAERLDQSKSYFYKDLGYYIKNAVMLEEMNYRNHIKKMNNTTSSDKFRKIELIQTGSDDLHVPTLDSSSLSFAMMPHNLNFNTASKPKFFQRQTSSFLNFPECSIKKQPKQGNFTNLNKQTLYQMGYIEDPAFGKNEVQIIENDVISTRTRTAKVRSSGANLAKVRSSGQNSGLKSAVQSLTVATRQSTQFRNERNQRSICTSYDKNSQIVFKNRMQSSASSYAKVVEKRINSSMAQI